MAGIALHSPLKPQGTPDERSPQEGMAFLGNPHRSHTHMGRADLGRGEDCPSLTSLWAWLPSVRPLPLWPRQPLDTGGGAGGNYPEALITLPGRPKPQIAQ